MGALRIKGLEIGTEVKDRDTKSDFLYNFGQLLLHFKLIHKKKFSKVEAKFSFGTPFTYPTHQASIIVI